LRPTHVIGIGDADRVAGGERTKIEIEARLSAGNDGSAVRGAVRKGLRQFGGKTIELSLCLNQSLIAHFQKRGDLARADRLVRDEIGIAARWRDQLDGA